MNRELLRSLVHNSKDRETLKHIIDTERANVMAYTVDNFSIAVASTLNSKFDVQSEQLIKMMKAIMYTFNSLDQNRVTFADLQQALLEETGVVIKPMTAILQRKEVK